MEAHKLKIHTLEEGTKPRSRSMYIRSSQGKRKVVDNQKYFDQITKTI